MSRTSVKTVVVGGGISGLSAAYGLYREGEPVLLLESDEQPGGVMKTDRVGPFLFEHGPNSIMNRGGAVDTLLDELSLAEDVCRAGEQADRRYILKDGTLHPVPMSLGSFFSTDLISWRARSRLLLEPFVRRKPRQAPETLAEFTERRLGPEVHDYMVSPFIAGVYAGSTHSLGARETVEQLVDWEQEEGSILYGALKNGIRRGLKRESSKRELISFPEGLTRLPGKLADELEDQLLLNASVEEITSRENGFDIRYRSETEENQIVAEQVIVATPAYVSSELVRSIDHELAKGLGRVSYAPLSVVYFGYENYPGERPLDGFGFLVPEKEERKILGTLWNSTIFPDRAPESGAVLTTFVGGARQPERTTLTDEELIETVQDELKEVLGLRRAPDVARVRNWDRAIPQYKPGHLQLLKKLTARERQFPGLRLLGNYRGGVSVPNCIKNGLNLAKEI